MRNISWILGVVISSALYANGASAANKTWVTDSLSAGKSRVDLIYGTTKSTPNGIFTISGTPSATNHINTASTLQLDYLLGVTDRLNIGINLNLAYPQSSQTNYSTGSNSYAITNKYDGAGDPSISAQYLLVDKNEESFGWVVSGTYTPVIADASAAVSEIKTNGAVTTSGSTGGAGNGYAITNLSSIMSVPVAAISGDFFVDVRYITDGPISVSGSPLQYGNKTMLLFGIEALIGEKTTFRPYVRSTSIAGGTSSTETVSSHSGYDLGLQVTHDISDRVTVSAAAEYNSMANVVVNYPNGNVWTYSGGGYTLGLRSSFFF